MTFNMIIRCIWSHNMWINLDGLNLNIMRAVATKHWEIMYIWLELVPRKIWLNLE